MRSRKTKIHIEEIAKNHGIKPSQMEEIAEAPFRFFVQIASEGNRQTMKFDAVRIMGFGLFLVKEGRKKFLKKLNDDRS